KFAAYLYNRGAQWNNGVAINYKYTAYPEGTAVFDIERGQLAEIRPYFWQTDTAVGKNSWGYVKNMDYKTADSIVDDLIDIVSKNGALLLNIGPAPDGTIPEGDRKILTEIGKWLAVAGEAIYGTRPWRIYGEGPTQVVAGSFSDTKRQPFTGEDFRFTRKGGTIYAIALDWPGGQAAIKALAKGSPHVTGEVAGVKLLGSEAKLKFTRDEGGLKIELPKAKPCENAFAFEITGLKTVDR
ncbi:MAG: alpha-L-fucosidase, partial [Candidatus Sumerlaeota bacterium]|nr:alpha-L-fucosidase [Candidatus Sumerlaeota bacterium]